MNKTDKLMVALLFCALIGWSFLAKKSGPTPEPGESAPVAEAVVVDGSPAGAAGGDGTVAPAATPPGVAPVVEAPVAEIVRAIPEVTAVLNNENVRLVFSSWGGGITKAELTQYPETMDADSGPVSFDFSKRPSLSYANLPGLSIADDFELRKLSDVNGIELTRESASGLSLSRVAILTNGYALVITDTLRNGSDAAITIPESQMNLGPMPNVKSKAKTRGISYLGVDTFSSAEKSRIAMRGKEITSLFGVKGGCSRPDLSNTSLTGMLPVDEPLSWVASKNKFFAQVLDTSDDNTRCQIFAGREDSPTAFTLSEVSVAVSLAETVLEPGASFERRTTYYVGPKKFSELKALGSKQDHIMLRSWKGFGWWRAACIGLLWLMNALKAVTFNYGIAVILLTIIVKVVFWPVTHKGTESMKRMQKLQPQLKKLREKHKDNPKKLQEKQMLLYRENNVNPVAGCLPMVIQMPVFIALFTVLRSAVELRYASFLWIADLSEPEGLLAGTIPYLAGGINILPLLMTGTMVLQQRLTPSAGDPQQQKMMQFMPLMMLFVFYNMASGLVLYWTVSQLLSILQLVMQQRKDKAEAVA
jgi:YidC/Oxa1 family membrane protein insertase